MTLNDLSQFIRLQQITLSDVDTIPELAEPVRGTDKRGNKMAASRRLLNDFESRTASGPQDNQFQTLLVGCTPAVTDLGIRLHIGYR